MLLNALHRIAAPTLYALMMARAGRSGVMPIATDQPLVHASGSDPDRILIMGGPAVMGLGVRSHDLGFAGSLARGLARTTGRGADVEAKGFEPFDLARCVAELERIELGLFDAVVLQVGSRELLSFTPAAVWEQGVNAVMRVLAERKPRGLPVLMMSTLPISQLINAPRWAERIMTSNLARMNQITRELCSQWGVAEFVQLRPEQTGPEFARATKAFYERWSDDIAPALDAALAAADPHAARTVVEAERQAALDQMHLSRGNDARIDRIVRMARDTFGVSAASLTVIDHDTQWIKSAAGMSDGDLPRDATVCNVTIDTPGVFIVEDLEADDTFADLPWVGSPDGQRFYAGYPVEAPGGQRIGALCVLDTAPRHFSRSDASMLRDLALRAQSVLWDEAAS